MYRKNLIMSLFAAAILLTGSFAVSAQTFIVRGTVQLRGADGTAAPLAGAIVEGFRTDIKGKTQPATTNKKGEYSIAGFQAGGVYVLVVSSPGGAPSIIGDVRASKAHDPFDFTMDAGDGRRLTQDEAVEMAKKGGAAVGPGTGTEVKKTAEQIKAQEEYEKNRKEIEQKNNRVQNADKLIRDALAAGYKAYEAKDYSTALTKYDEGLQADPDYVGSVPLLLNNKSEAYRLRGFDKHKEAVKTQDAALKKAVKEDMTAAYDSAAASLDFIQKATAPTDAKELAAFQKNKLNAFVLMAAALNTMSINEVDGTRADDIKRIYPQLIALETDAAKKERYQREFSDSLRKSQACEAAVAEYQKILDTKPQDPDALVGKGLCLVNVGAMKEDKEVMQQGLNVLQIFVDVAPDTHRLKADAKGTIEYLKTEQKLAPQKGTGKKKT